MNFRFIHHFTIADIGSVVTFRSNPERGTVEVCLEGKVGIITAIDTDCSFGQKLLVNFNYVLKYRDQSIGPIWKVSGDNLAPLASWIIDGDSKGNSLLLPSIRRGAAPRASIDPDATTGPTAVVGSTPRAFFFATPPSVEFVRAHTPTRDKCRDGLRKTPKACAH